MIFVHKPSTPLSLLKKHGWWSTLVRGKDVVQALTMLKFMPNYAAKPVSKLLASAVANAEENFGVSRDDLFVYRIYR